MLYVTVTDLQRGQSDTRSFRGEVLVGTDASCTIVLVDPAVRPRHLQITPSGSGVTVTVLDPSAEATLADGRRITDRILLGDEAVLHVGGFKLGLDVRKDPFEETTELDDSLNTAEAHLACTQSFHCPKRWSALLPTPDPTTRSCPECQRDVHLVWTEEMYNRAVQLGHCAAIMAGDPPDLGFDSEKTSPGDDAELNEAIKDYVELDTEM